jgi:hypothetical protein
VRRSSPWWFYLLTARDVSVETQQRAERLTPVKTRLHGGSPKLQRFGVILFFLDFACKSGVGSPRRLFSLEFPIAGTRTAMVLVLAS